MPDSQTSKPIRIAYLFGAGASQAEVDRINPSSKILSSDISETVFDGIFQGSSRLKSHQTIKYFSQTDARNLNIEHVISLLDGLETRDALSAADLLRKRFQQEILGGVLDRGKYIHPNLTCALLKAHHIKEVQKKETLNGIISLNYDSFLDIAFQEIYGGVNYGVRCKSVDYDIITDDEKVPPLLKIHGSFNWKIGSPMVISEKKKFLKSFTSLWIPPSINKKVARYPFHYLWGKSFEILDCDVLRVVGCSFHQNDWGLLDLLLKDQFLRNEPFEIQFINSPGFGSQIRKNYAFLKKVVSIEEIDLPIFEDSEFDETGEYIGESSNFFERWLKVFLKSLKPQITENNDKKILNDYIGEILYEI